ncbi:hypothetical protein G6F43_011053 [Rhizopus delemar]|nr:hypothetical protein G6F43_011053 [Rhizopus delemar]
MYNTKTLVIGAIPIGLLAITHLKSLPLVYTIRAWLLLRSLIRKAKANQLRPDPLFSTVIQEHRCYLDDIDYNQHMNNSMYNKALDFSRIEIFYTIVPKIMMEPDHHIFAHNAGVVTLFKKEIPPFSKYTVESRIYTWNDKWAMIQHRFVLDDGGVACYALSKTVFKKLSGRTIPPRQVFQLCGHDLQNSDVEERRSHNWKTAEHMLNLDKVMHDPYVWKSSL